MSVYHVKLKFLLIKIVIIIKKKKTNPYFKININYSGFKNIKKCYRTFVDFTTCVSTNYYLIVQYLVYVFLSVRKIKERILKAIKNIFFERFEYL